MTLKSQHLQRPQGLYPDLETEQSLCLLCPLSILPDELWPPHVISWGWSNILRTYVRNIRPCTLPQEVELPYY